MSLRAARMRRVRHEHVSWPQILLVEVHLIFYRTGKGIQENDSLVRFTARRR